VAIRGATAGLSGITLRVHGAGTRCPSEKQTKRKKHEMSFCGNCRHFKPWRHVRLTHGDGECLITGRVVVAGSSCFDVFPGEAAVDRYAPCPAEETEK